MAYLNLLQELSPEFSIDYRMLPGLEEKENKGILITDHLFKYITDICDNLYLLADGKIHLTKEIGDIEVLGYAKF
jgi:ABC-type lipopolysaccharide export system ATPase subunit